MPEDGDRAPLIEPVTIVDEFVTGLAAIEDVSGCCARFVWYSEQTCYEAGGKKVWIVSKRLVMPRPALRLVFDAAGVAIGRRFPLKLVT